MSDETCFVLNNAEQLDITREQAERLEAAGLIYHPEEDNPYYYTIPWDVSLDDVEAFIAREQEGYCAACVLPGHDQCSNDLNCPCCLNTAAAIAEGL